MKDMTLQELITELRKWADGAISTLTAFEREDTVALKLELLRNTSVKFDMCNKYIDELLER